MKQTHTIYAVTADAGLGKRIQDALRIPELKTEIGSNFPPAGGDCASADLLVLDCLDESAYRILGEIRKDNVGTMLPVIGLIVKFEKDQFMPGYYRGTDMNLMRDFNPEELRSFVLRIIKYLEEPEPESRYAL